ncbi:GDSL esterase/lipase At4g01130 isoform X1 [Physcomitrium patens]|uniref:Uncharacterized protein n=1 Tax=Physcomitrium patens TaxID=3218 RepID=A0A2K1IP55_PHYPA|nr:uncharacterized protein LOC112274859 isoform X1 [Physcomitrium patens]PNR31061.1 hypothetical protein PHYPA_027377 [Physcomitrium patens]|eukprot:XP_024360447.1 uncharacterized protein LOC112274859 isoform X1 [Physcomitrella patens]
MASIRRQRSALTWTVLTALYVVSWISLVEISSKALPNCSYPAVYSFGDSLSDVGNSITTFPDKFALSELDPFEVEYPMHADDRLSDGKLLVDFIGDGRALGLRNCCGSEVIRVIEVCVDRFCPTLQSLEWEVAQTSPGCVALLLTSSSEQTSHRQEAPHATPPDGSHLKALPHLSRSMCRFSGLSGTQFAFPPITTSKTLLGMSPVCFRFIQESSRCASQSLAAPRSFVADIFRHLLVFVVATKLPAENSINQSLYTVFAGFHDYVFDLYTTKLSPGEALDAVSDVVDAMVTTIEDLVKLEAKDILVVNLPPLGCIPALLTLFPGNSSDQYDAYGCL